MPTLAISNCLFSPTSENPHGFSVWCVLAKFNAKPRNYSQPRPLYATFMNLSILFIFFLTLAACSNSSLQTDKAVPKTIHIPDTTNNWYAKLFDYPNYVRKTEIAKQLNLDNLEADTSNSEIRIWTIGSNYNPQTLISLKNKNNIWTITKLNYYLSFSSLPSLL